MVSQRCPKCLSRRVRRGYRPTPLWSKILFRYNLLCDNCNWEFKGFAVPGTVSAKPTKSPKKKTVNRATENATDEISTNNQPDAIKENVISLENQAIESVQSEKKGKRRKSGV